MIDIVERLRAPHYWMSGSAEGHEGENSAPLEAAAEIERLRAALAPSSDTKAAYSGEFHFEEYYLDEDSNDAVRKITVPWATVKEIMAAIRARAALGGDNG